MTAQQLIIELTEACKPLVEHIEGSPALTKDRYDQYMRAISEIASRLSDVKSVTAIRLAGVALIYAKANKAGVQAALKIMGGL